MLSFAVNHFFRLMKTPIILIFFCVALVDNVLSQTLEKEISNLTRGFIENRVTPEEQKNRSKIWRDLIDKVGYPKMPYDSATNEVSFNSIIELPAVDKKTITNRILEWAAISFGSLNDVLHYRNDESGKLILKGFKYITYSDGYKNLFGQDRQKLNNAKCNMVIVFTIKDSKLKMEFNQITFSFEYTDFTTGVRSSTLHGIDEIYPVTNYKSSEWDAYLSLLRQTNKFFGIFKIGLSNYINGAKKDYEF